MKFLSYPIIFYCLLFVTISVNAQLYEVSRYADNNGLPSRIIRDVIQDHNGFLWVAGNNGLYKFDGQKFLPYYSVLKDTTGLRDNKITAILEGKDGKIWIGTPKGLHVLENGIISHLEIAEEANESQNYITTLKEDANHNIWIGTYGGLFVSEKEEAQVLNLSHPDISAIPEKLINSFYIDTKERFLILSSDGIFMSSDDKDYAFAKVTLSFKNGLAKNNTSLYKILNYNNEFMIIDSNKGLLKATWENDSVLNIGKFLDKNGNQIANHFIYNSMIDHENNIWIATWKNKFKKYKVENNTLVEQKVISTNGLLDMSGNCISIYEDAQHNIWIANTNGLYKLTASENKMFTFPPRHLSDCFPNGFAIYDIIEDNNNHIWITTPNELYRFKKTDIMNGICPTDFFYKKDASINLPRNLFIDSQNRLWIGAEGGLSVTQLDEHSNPGKFKQYTKKDGLPHNWSFEIIEEDKNNFWIANYHALVKLTIKNGDLESTNFKIYQSESKDLNTIVNSYTIEIEKDKNGDLWIGTFHGLSKLISEEESGHFANYLNSHGDFKSLSNNSIKRVFKDKSDLMWIGTQTGLNLYDDKTDSFIQFGRHDGLPSEYILGIDEDSKGFLWIATTNGVIKTKYDSSLKKLSNIRHFTTREGLADNITYKNALYIDQEDNVFIGSRNGLSILSNYDVSNKEVMAFNLEITSLQNIKKNDIDFSAIKNENKQEEINLSYIENSIKINYAVLDFSQPEFNRYRHKILPYNNNWVETENSSELTYYNLPAGSYEFILDGSNNQEQWSDKPLSIKFKITPPFWRSKIALLIYAILAASILRFFYLLRVRKQMRELEHKAKLEYALVNEREQLRQENSADFHDELGSKVTKISLFLTLAERSLKNKEDPSAWFNKIRFNIKDLSGGFRDLLWVIDPKKDSLSDTFLRLKDFGEELFETAQIDFRTKGYHIDQDKLMLDPQTKKQVVMIFKEAMNNSVKYSECEHAVLTISATNQFSNIELTDNGKGFEFNKKSKGRGLKNMINRANKINAELIIITNHKGTSIQLNRIHHMSDNFKAEEM